ncbi:hypothetical protein ACFQI7_33965 [Paenibacillus allorhizosphaerae]|uniref:DUF1868 domain-containing protein n=1 Tax=Paenibacillus allorhizosphaerae TaxID=2849866 RepID=A0ABN7TUI6_9BACL|nr:hypothetical protein [Paenibacillus allorhizosphaerae]CAG7656364.1 hypothetical protein PAECIP111802_06371 [Paenibacillus allorhizosphaerae]
MIAITNRKVAGLTPVWAPFHGFSLLFDNPGQSVAAADTEGKLEAMACSPDEPALSLYRTFWEQSGELEQLLASYLLCPLPFHSYHVTVWDGLNVSNVKKISTAHSRDAERFVSALPESLLVDSPFVQRASGEAIRIDSDGDIRFVYDALENRGNSALVVNVKAADPESAARLKEVERLRSELNADFQERFGIATASADYRPHVSLGYFANKDLGEQSAGSLKRLDDILRKQSEGKTIAFSSISLYGMTDMQTFIRKRQAGT